MTDEHIVFLLRMTTALSLLILVVIVIVSSVGTTQNANEITEELSEVSKFKTTEDRDACSLPMQAVRKRGETR